MWKAVFLFGFLLVVCYATASLVGGFEDAEIDDEDVVTAANHATKQLSKQFASKYHHSLVKVKKAKKQIVLLLGFLVAACCAIPGGYEDAQVDDEDVVTAAHQATEQLSKHFASIYHHSLVKVIKANRQVVAGLNYRLDIIVGMTTCRKDEVEFEEAANCEYQDGLSTYKKCQVLVYKNLDGEHRLVSSGCVLASKKEI